MTESNKLSRHIKDKCYGLWYLTGKDDVLPDLMNDSPYSVPGNILREILDKNRPHAEHLLKNPVSPDLEGLLPEGQNGSYLMHVFGTWHVAEECLAFGRIKYTKEPNRRSGEDTPSLTSRLRYGPQQADTLIEEFSLAAFFQAYLGNVPESGHDKRDNEKTGDLKPVRDVIVEQLRKNTALEKYQEGNLIDPINLDVIAYWVSGQGKPIKLGDGLSEEAKQSQNWKKVTKSTEWKEFHKIKGEMIKRVRSLFFAPDAPLNLRHLDLIGRIYWDKLMEKNDNTEKERNVSPILRGFISRILLSKRIEGHAHLLPKNPWADRCPYYVPNEIDLPTYRFLEPYVEVLQMVNEKMYKGDGRTHTLCRAYGTIETDDEDGKEYRTGLLRLSLLHQRQTNFDAKVLSRNIALATDKLPPFAAGAPELADD